MEINRCIPGMSGNSHVADVAELSNVEHGS